MISQIIVFIFGFLSALLLSVGIYFLYLKKEKYIFHHKLHHTPNVDRIDENGLIDVDFDGNDDLPFINDGRKDISIKYDKKRYDRNFHKRSNYNHNVHQVYY